MALVADVESAGGATVYGSRGHRAGARWIRSGPASWHELFATRSPPVPQGLSLPDRRRGRRNGGCAPARPRVPARDDEVLLAEVLAHRRPTPGAAPDRAHVLITSCRGVAAGRAARRRVQSGPRPATAPCWTCAARPADPDQPSGVRRQVTPATPGRHAAHALIAAIRAASGATMRPFARAADVGGATGSSAATWSCCRRPPAARSVWMATSTRSGGQPAIVEPVSVGAA